MIAEEEFEVNMDYRGYHHELQGGIVSMPKPENVIIKKGFFPDTARNVEDMFCYVHLDIYQSTIDGLHFFGLRLLNEELS